MSKIYVGDGNSFVWQWQTKEQIVLEGYPEGVFVHFANCDTVEAPVVQTRMEGDKLVADIPPELMQSNKDITIYICDADGTMRCHFLSVLSRPKPESYVTEPVEVLRYESLATKIPFNENYEGKLLFVQNGVAIPLDLGPGLVVRDGVLYVTGASPEEPEKPVEGVTVTLGADGTILLSCAAELDDSGTITLPVPVTLTEDGVIMIGGNNNGKS